MSIILQDQLTLSTQTKEQVEKNTQDIAELEQKISTVYKFKGSVEYYSDLPPASQNETGDVWDVQEDDMNYAWTADGTWDPLGPTVDFSAYVPKTTEINGHALSSDVNLNAADVGAQETLVSGENIKTVNGTSVLGSGNITITTNYSFKDTWTKDGTFQEFLDDVYADQEAVPGMSYIGELTCSSGLPTGLGNVEAVVEVMPSAVASKVLHVIITSGNYAPYHWECSYWETGTNPTTPHYSGWISFQPKLTPGTGIDITNNTISANAMVGSNGTTAGSAGIVPAPAKADNTKFLKGDGTWATVDALPAQSGQSGKFLTTDGSTASWAEINTDIKLTDIASAGTNITFTTPTIDDYSIAGTDVTVAGGVASGFSTSSYVYKASIWNSVISNNVFEYNTKINISSLQSHDIVFAFVGADDFTFYAAIESSGKISCIFSGSNGTYYRPNSGTYYLTTNKDYWIRLLVTQNSDIKIYVSENGSSYDLKSTTSFDRPCKQDSHNLELGWGNFYTLTSRYFTGSIDLTETNFKDGSGNILWAASAFAGIPSINATDTTYSAFTGADGVNAGTAGLVPAPAATDNEKFLRGDGTWSEVKQLEAYQSLTAAQRTILLNNGTYDGKAVTPGTIFTQYDGTFQKFTKKQVIDETEFVDSGNTIPDGISYYVTKIDKNGTDFYMAIPIDNGYYGYTLTDGENWTSTNSIISSKREAHVGALYKNGVWACEDGNSGFFRYSEDDGETWIESPTSPGTPTTQFSLEGGYFVACFGYAPPCYSANGKDWIQINSNMSNVYGITYDGTQWIAITDYKHIYTNDDITNDNTWIEVIFQTAPICNTFYAITYNDGIYYAYGAAYLNGAWCNIVETSPDLLNWTHSDKIFPDNDGWSGGYSRFICNGNFVAIEINNSMWYTLDQGSTWSDEIATHGHSTLIGNELWDVYEGTIYTFNTISHLGNILENISYNKSEVDTLLNQRLRVIHGGNSINVELDGDAANITYLPSTAYEAPTPQTWSYDGTLLTDMQNKKSYINMGYDSDTGNYIWKEVQTGSSQPTYDAATKTIIF